MPYSKEENCNLIKNETPESNAKRYFKEANKLFDEKKWEDSIKIFNKAIKLDPNFSSAIFNRGLAFFILNQNVKAKKDINAVITLQPTKSDAPYIMGIISENEGSIEEAKKMFSLALERNPEHIQAKNRLLQLDEREKKIRIDSLQNEAKKLYDEGSIIEAFELLQEAIKNRPEDPCLHCNLGNMYANVNEYHAALLEYSIATKNDSKNPVILNNKSYSLARVGKINEAFKEIKIVCTLDPSNPVFLFTYAQIFALNSDVSGGLNFLKKIISSKKMSSSDLCKEAKREISVSSSLEKINKVGFTENEKKLLLNFISQNCKSLRPEKTRKKIKND
jgi:tetratricopeptide (TPR) repeat protein